jgi:hypothetical protein
MPGPVEGFIIRNGVDGVDVIRAGPSQLSVHSIVL